MGTSRTLKRVVLTDRHQSTGRTRHFIAGEEMQRPIWLEISQYSGDAGFYLFYCDSSGVAMSDTYHDSLDAALSQANWEFSVSPEEWSDVNEIKIYSDPPPIEELLHEAHLVRIADPWQLRLLKMGHNPLAVLRVLLSLLKLPLSDLKRLTSELPQVVLTFSSESQALPALAQLESAGASAEITPKSDV